jgi:DNA-binding transcriptional LysR family regulator
MRCEAWLHNAAMAPELLPAIAAFARVAHHASFTRAAAELGVSASALSQTLKTLEARLGVRLLDRTTRKVGLTEIGRQFLLGAQPGLAALTLAVDSVSESREKPAGLLRLNLSRTAADILVLPHLVDFLRAYPDVTVDIHCDDQLVELVGGGFDAGIRLGENLAQDVVAVPLGGPQRIATVAAPSYLAEHKPPRTPEDLRQHLCLNVRLGGGIYRWEYSHKGRDFEIETSGPLIANDGDTMIAALLAGAGVGCAFEGQLAAHIASGRLTPLLKAWWPVFPGFYLYYPSRVHMPRKLRVFVDFMQQRLNG